MMRKANVWMETHPPSTGELVDEYAKRVALLFFEGERGRRRRPRSVTETRSEPLTFAVKQVRTSAREYYHKLRGNMPQKPHKIVDHVEHETLGPHFLVSYHVRGYKCPADKWMPEDEVRLWPQLLEDYKAVRKSLNRIHAHLWGRIH